MVSGCFVLLQVKFFLRRTRWRLEEPNLVVRRTFLDLEDNTCCRRNRRPRTTTF